MFQYYQIILAASYSPIISIEGKTYASVELKLALQKGYTIDKLYSALHYEKYKGLMKDYVEFFLGMKIKSTQKYTQEECRSVVAANVLSCAAQSALPCLKVSG